MAIEIERKFLLDCDLLRQSGVLLNAEKYHIQQAYLSRNHDAAQPGNSVRVRIVADQAYLTIKGPSVGISRPEFEFPITLADAEQLLPMCIGYIINKTRYLVRDGSHVWEVDEFHGAHQGLWLAEIELSHELECFNRPIWLTQEVSEDPRYHNSALALRAMPLYDLR